ncbi:MAG: copper chaperone PCu(A)C [Sphingomonas sp.]
MRAFAGIIALALVAACHQAPAELKVTGAWVRLPAVQEGAAAGYFTISGGEQPTTLLSVSAPFAIRTELHESMAGGQGMMAMKPLKDVAIPKRGTVVFAPGGRHVMLFDVGPNLHAGTRAPLTLNFADRRAITVDAQVLNAGDPPPAPPKP